MSHPLGYRDLVLARLPDVDGRTRLEDALERVADPGCQRPRLRRDVEIARFTTRWGERYAIAHSPATRAYLRLTGEEDDLVRRLDGVRDVRELIAEDLGREGGLDAGQVAELTDVLWRHGLLDRQPVDVYAAVRERLLPARRRLARAVWEWLRRQTIDIPRADAFVRATYRGGGRLCFTRTANLLAVLVLAGGLASFVAVARAGRYGLSGRVSTRSALSLLALGLAALFVHEMGHALAVRHAGRRIVNAGFQLYLGHPAFFIDSSDLLLAPRRARAVNALAGPYAEAVAAGIAALVALGSPASVAEVAFRFAGLTYLNVLLNLVPFIELDGYWLLSDLIDVARLRPRAVAVLRYELPDRLLGRRGAFSASERALAAFGVLGVAFTVAALVTAWVFWGGVVQRLVVSMWRAGMPGRAVLALLAVLVAGPLAHTIGHATRVAGRRARDLVGDLRFHAQTSWRTAAAEAVAALPIVGELDETALGDLAGRITRRRVREGAVLVRQGEAADAFYVVRRGRFAIVEPDADGRERVIRRVGAGESFGELALLERRPRTATVRAEADSEVYTVDAGTFQRLLAPAMDAPELAPAVRSMLEVWSLPPFRRLPQHDAAVLADHGQWLSLAPGETVVEQGDVADGFYTLAAGQAEVVRDGRRVATLSPGEHFGEIALLRAIPRTATVRTLTPAHVFRIDESAFRTLVAGAFARGTLRVAGDASTTSGAH